MFWPKAKTRLVSEANGVGQTDLDVLAKGQNSVSERSERRGPGGARTHDKGIMSPLL